MYACDGSQWTARTKLPGVLATKDNKQSLVMIPIDAYGVVWLITSQNGSARAWLFKP